METDHCLILHRIKIEQKNLLDKLELAYVDRPQEWRLLRSAILRAFGNDGLEGYVRYLIQQKKSTTTR